MKEFPLYPELSEEAAKEAQSLIDKFKDNMSKAAKEAIDEFYCDTMMYIESDSWSNFRNQIMDGYQNYNNKKIHGEYDFKKIRRSILENYREEIIKDLNQDLLEEIKSLKKQIVHLTEIMHNRF